MQFADILLQAEVFKADFELERKDREEAAGKYDQSLCQLEKRVKDLTSQLQLQKAEKIRLEQELKEMKLVSAQLHSILKLQCKVIFHRKLMKVFINLHPRLLVEREIHWYVLLHS